MRGAILGLVVAAAAAVGPATAHAAEVHGLPNGNVLYTAAPGEDNKVSTHEQAGFVHFLETGATVTPGPFCETVGFQVRCLASGLGVVHILLGDGDNWASNGFTYETHISGQGATKNVFFGGPGTDEMRGGAAHDSFHGNGGEDRLYGEGGDDDLDGGAGADGFWGGAGRDAVSYASRFAPVNVSLGSDLVANDGELGEGDDVKSDVESVVGGQAGDRLAGQDAAVDNALYGGGGDDQLSGSPGNDALVGGEGNDLLSGGAGADAFFGGEGAGDVVSYAAYTAPVAVDLDGETYDDGATGESDWSSADVESVIGGAGSDTLTGSAAANMLRGGPGDDRIDGLAGADQLFGEAGDDTLLSQDGEVDLDDCGDGSDTTVSDPADARSACEFPVAGVGPATPGGTTGGAPAAATGPLVRIGPPRLRLDRRGYARLRVRCPASAAQRCTGTLGLSRTSGGRTRTYGSRRFTIATGSPGVVRVRVVRRVRRTIGRRGVRVRALANARDAVSSATASKRSVRILPRRRDVV